MVTLPKAITFDCYGTLIDWEGEIQQLFSRLLASKHIKNVNASEVHRYWEEIQFQYIQQYRPYRQVLRDTMKVTFEHFSLPYTDADGESFARSMGSWKPFPDTKESILELQKYVKVVLITNTDDSIIAETEKTIGVHFDDIITAEQARAYKPSYAGFRLAQQRLGLDIADIWHAGFGFKYDIVPATHLGYTTVWVNRQAEARPADVNVKETFLVGDMRTLAYFVKGVATSA